MNNHYNNGNKNSNTSRKSYFESRSVPKNESKIEVESIEFENDSKADLNLDGETNTDGSLATSSISDTTQPITTSNSNTPDFIDSSDDIGSNSSGHEESLDEVDDSESLDEDMPDETLADSDEKDSKSGKKDQEDKNKDDNSSSESESKKQEDSSDDALSNSDENKDDSTSSESEGKNQEDSSKDASSSEKKEDDNSSNDIDKQKDLEDKKDNNTGDDTKSGDSDGKKDETKDDSKDSNASTNEKSDKDSGDKKSLKERAQEKKEDIKDSAKDKFDNSSLGRKYNDAKNFVNDPKQFAQNKFNDSRLGKGIDAARNIRNNPKDALKNMARDKFNDSRLGREIQKGKDTVANAKKAVDKTKKAVDKTKKAVDAIKKSGGVKAAAKGLLDAFIAGLPVSAIVLAIAIILAVAGIFICLSIPGIGGDSNDEDGFSNYSNKDQKVLEKIHKIFGKYPNADGTLAMAIVAYPYFDNLHSGNVSSYIKKEDEEEAEEEDNTDTLDEGDKGADDGEDVEDEVDKDESDNDMYLSIFRKSKVRRRLINVLKNLNNKSEDEFKSWLKPNYFKKDSGFIGDGDYSYSGYKGMLKYVDKADKDAFMDEVIKDLYDIKDYFMNYVYSKVECNSSASSLGYSTAGDIIKGEPVVVIKDTASPYNSSIMAAPSLYGTDTNPLPLGRYILGIVYAEIGDAITNEAVSKAQMIAAKSYLLGRTQVSVDSPGSIGMGRAVDYNDTQTIFYMRGNDCDQVYCDIYEGCGDTRTVCGEPGTMMGKSALSNENIALVEKWWDETVSEYVYDDAHGVFAGGFMQNYGGSCQRGYCLSQSEAEKQASIGQDYMSILFGSAGAFSNYVLYNGETSSISKVTSVCSPVTPSDCKIPDEEFVYYSQRDYNDTFCGRTDNATIKFQGCGPTSMAMVLANLVDKNFEPVSVMNEAHAGGYCGVDSNGKTISGTLATFFKPEAEKYGLTYDSVPSSDTSKEADDKIKDTLKSGGLVIANVTKGWSDIRVGHYLVIRGITSDDRLILADPMVYRSETGGDPLNNPWKNNLTINEMRRYMTDRSFHLFTGGKSDEIKEKYCKTGGAGYLGNPINPSDTTANFMEAPGNAKCFPLYCGGSSHGGVDLSSVTSGTPVYAMDGGVVEMVLDYSSNCYNHSTGSCPVCGSTNDSYGIYVRIDHENGYKTVYAHLSKRIVNKGDKVSKGQQIGISGNTGCSSGDHLHIELQKTDLLDANGRTAAKSSSGKGLMNPAKYINSDISYVGQTE